MNWDPTDLLEYKTQVFLFSCSPKMVCHAVSPITVSLFLLLFFLLLFLLQFPLPSSRTPGSILVVL